uniref:BTB domain-containing protein n=1 Tax=Panagrellus redivivus TaxID=6233 RepID=A0A7E4V3U0_PANRE
MASKHIYATFNLTLDYMYNAKTGPMTDNVRTYFRFSDYNNTVTYTLHMYSLVEEAGIFHISLKVTGSPVFASGVLHVNLGCVSESELAIEKKACPPGESHDLLSEVFDLLFMHRNNADIVIELVLEPIPDNSSFTLPCPTAYEFAARDPVDVAFAVDGDKLPAHRGFLSGLSPVFRAMFTHDTVEARTGFIEITDFDMVTVTNAINFCYGNDTGPKSVSEVLSMSRFADKYDIQPVVKRCEKALSTHITLENFCDIADYVWTLTRDELKSPCIEFFRQNPKIALTPSFARLPLAVREGIIQEAVIVE